MSYREYLKSNHWKRLRDEAIVLSKGTCWRCGRKMKYGSIEIHHLKYLPSLLDTKVKDIRAVHAKCHREIEAKKGTVEYRLK